MQEAFPAKTGAELVALRKHLGVEQQDVATALKVHRTTLNRWEKPEATVSPIRWRQYEAACLAILQAAA